MGLGECLLNVADIKVGLDRMEKFFEVSHPRGPNVPHRATKGCIADFSIDLEYIKSVISCLVPHKSRSYSPHSSLLVSLGSFIAGQPVLKDWTELVSYSSSKVQKPRLSLNNISCSWSDDTGRKTLTDISLNITGGQLVVVTGPVGSGKSSLLMAILGELPLSAGQISSSANVAYVSQIPWVFSGTVRENITFGRKFDEKKYREVLKACGLLKDLANFAKGDSTRIGERGVSLSGGQRARVSLARAVYSEADIYLLDDPLSAVDAKVGKYVFERCICGLLANRLRVFTTHQLQYIDKADHVVVLREGEVLQEGSYTQLKNTGVIPELNSNDACMQKKGKLKARLSNRASVSIDHFSGSYKDLEEEDEDRMVGSLGWRLYWNYFRAGVPAPLLLCLLVLVILVQGKKKRGCIC